MESFYYVLLYSSVLWLPREEEEGFEKLVSEYFDEYQEMEGTVQGGAFKAVNIETGFFRNIWIFHNTLVQRFLDDILELQRPFEDQPSWTPQALYAIIKSMDEEDLPLDDRIDHQSKKGKLARRRARYAPRRTAVPAKLEAHPVTPVHTSSTHSGASSKRGADEAGLKERVESIKRPCCIFVDRHEEQGRSCECF